MRVTRGTDAPVTLYVTDRDGSNWDPAANGFLTYRLSIADRPGGTVVYQRSTAEADLVRVVEDGLIGIQGDPITPDELADLAEGFYVLEAWFQDGSGNWFPTDPVRVSVIDPVGGLP
jgi:hypothetical protein